jgi:glucose-1-phosphate adenylyltransferase
MAVGNVVTIIMAGGAGERLQPLTQGRTKPAVPFGGKFRLIDFTLSNCVNSGLRQIFILTQYRSTSLIRHVQEGWDISSSNLGDYIYCIPAQQKVGPEWYRGTADAVRQNLDLINEKGVEHVLILSGDHVYKMNYLQMLNYHKVKDADLTISASRSKKEEAAGSLGVLEVDPEYRMVGFEEKPAQPKTIPGASDYVLASMGVYIFKVSALIEMLQGQLNDFGKNVIPSIVRDHFSVFVYDYEKENRISDFFVEIDRGKRRKTLVERTRDSSYWKDVGSIDSYYQASMELTGIDPIFNLYGEKWPIRTYQRSLPPSKCIIGGTTLESIVCDGCIISGGRVWRAILSPNVIVERGAVVEEAIVFDDVVIEPDARVRRAIIDKEAVIESGASIGYDTEADKKRGCTVSASGIVVVPKGVNIKPI